MNRKDVLDSPLFRKGHPHNTHSSRAFKRIKLEKDLEELYKESINTEIEEYFQEPQNNNN